MGKNKGVKRVSELETKLKQAIEYARQQYHLPQNVYDVFRVLVPEKVEYTWKEVESWVDKARETKERESE